jgi:hypothetical protein
VLGRWAITPDASAPSAPNVYRQLARLKSTDAARVFESDLEFASVTARVKCKPESQAGDPTGGVCGLMLHVTSPDDYLLIRASAHDGALDVVKVANGQPQPLISTTATMRAGAWHRLEATARWGSVHVRLDGAEVAAATYETRGARGGVGLWTAGDSVTSYDDLEATAE